MLNGLPQGQRQFVTEQLSALAKDYATDLATRANQLTRLHLPIKGKADEDAVRQAYDYLQKASKFEMADSDAVTVKLELVSDKIAEYYLVQGQKAIDKPRGTGVALGYLLLLEGQRFKPDNEALRNAITKYAPEYDTRGKASIFVQFRDQTSRRDSLGFADQLSDTVASRLESSGTRGVKVLARNRDLTDPTTATGAQLANFLLSGDIVQHRVDKKMDAQRLVSHYRAGTREVKSAEWLEAKRQADDAQREYERIAEANKAIFARNKKKEIDAAQKMFDDQSKKVAAARSKLDSMQETELQDIIQPYNYTKRVYGYNAVVEVAYKTSEMFADSAMQADSVKVEHPKNSSVLENVKAEDSDGVVEEGAAPDELQMFAEAETKIQTDLMGKLNKWLGDLPGKVLADARDRAKSGDKEAAAAKYVIYLNSTPDQETKERNEAINFLRDEFNITSLKPVQ
jgi:archaellum component FlaC